MPYVHVTDFSTHPSPSATRPLATGSHRYMVVLNYDLPRTTPHLWDQASVHVCGDGGANRLYHELPAMMPDEDPDVVRRRYIPDVVLGDLDSVEESVVKFYQSQGTVVINQSYDQDTNDLHKCMTYIAAQGHVSRDTTEPDDPGAGNGTEEPERNGKHHHDVDVARRDDGLAHSKVFIVGGVGGRLDQEFANVNVLFSFEQLPAVLISNHCLLMLLPSGRNRIVPDRSMEGPSCGLIPFNGPTVASSTGLKWNLDDTEMRFGGLISTSNEIESDVVTVETNQPLIWTTELRA